MLVPAADGGEGPDHAAVEVEPSGAQVREQRTILVADPQQVADHQRRHGPREVRDQVHPPVAVRLPFEPVELFVDDGLHAREPGGQAARGELRGEQPPHLGVVRRVAEPEATGIELPSDARAADHVAEVVAERPVVGQHGPHLVVAGHHPAPHTQREPDPAYGRTGQQFRCRIETVAVQCRAYLRRQGVEQPGS